MQIFKAQLFTNYFLPFHVVPMFVCHSALRILYRSLYFLFVIINIAIIICKEIVNETDSTKVW